MHVAILTYGSRGDVQPFVALGAGLRRAGHGVTLAAPARFAPLAAAQALGFVPLPGDVAQLSRELADLAGDDPIAQARLISAHGRAIAVEVMAALRAAVRGADLVVHSFITTGAGHALARELGVPDVAAQLFPFFVPYDAFPNVALPAPTLGPALNRLSHQLATLIFALSGYGSYAWLRRRSPELGPARLPWAAPGRRTPLLLAYSPLVVGPTPPPSPLARATGFWALEPAGYEPPPALAAFLAAGPPPVFVGFGSMAPQEGARLAATVLEALRRGGRRAILQRGWAGLGDGPLPDEILAIDEAPHDWLFPRMAAVIHHGGAGTTAAALRSGAPSLAVPFTADQPFWGRRAHLLGVGPPPIPARALAPGALAPALQSFDAPATRRRAAAVGAALRAEDGVGVAVRLIEGRRGAAPPQ